MFKSAKSLRKLVLSSFVTIFTVTAIATGALAVSPSQTTSTVSSPLPWMDTSLSPEARSELLIDAMTLDQKIQQLAGARGAIPELQECGNPGRHVPGIPELGIPTFRITNGPVCLGGSDCSPQDKATSLPVALALAASFDQDLAYAYGNLMGGEARTLGLHE